MQHFHIEFLTQIVFNMFSLKVYWAPEAEI